MKKVCLLDFDISITGGVGQVTESLANSLAKFYEVHVVSIQYKNVRTKYKFGDEIKVVSLNNKSKRLHEVPMSIFKALKNYLKINQIDVVLLMGQYSACASLLVQKMVKSKFVFCDHGALMNQWKDKKITLIRLLASKCSERTVTLTEATKEDYIKHFKTSTRKVLCIHNWIDDELMKKEDEYKADSLKIISVGRLSPEKGYDMLIEVAKKVLPENPEWIWEIYGEGECYKDISENIIKNKLDKQLILKGNIDNITDLYKEYAFLVLTSYREGLPLVLLEAKACKLPLISFDIVTGPGEIIRNNVDGILVEPYDIDKMADAVNKLIKEKVLRKEMSKNSRGNIEEFKKEHILKQWITLINGLV